MKLLLSAPGACGTRLLLAARGCGLDAMLFDHSVSRDPTLELPELARIHRPGQVLFVHPEREDPWTVELVRRGGAKVMLWCAPVAASAPAVFQARRQWIGRAADRIAVTERWLCGSFQDRSGRPAVYVQEREDVGQSLRELMSHLEE
ncbi:MAG: hypothetical protein V2A76_15375 [Planctomycetota bacterium]